MAQRTLVIGNKRYSSWSLRAWIAMTRLGLEFEQTRIPLYRPETRAEILEYSPTGLVPCLVDGGITVYESIAILEYLNEVYAQGSLLPRERRERAIARTVCAEMHAGFAELRMMLPTNFLRKPGPRAGVGPIDPVTQQQIVRILSMWEALLSDTGSAGGPYLFGEWSMADCMYLPVATRFNTYEVDTSAFPRSTDYMGALLALPEYQAWLADAALETEINPEYEQ